MGRGAGLDFQEGGRGSAGRGPDLHLYESYVPKFLTLRTATWRRCRGDTHDRMAVELQFEEQVSRSDAEATGGGSLLRSGTGPLGKKEGALERRWFAVDYDYGGKVWRTVQDGWSAADARARFERVNPHVKVVRLHE